MALRTITFAIQATLTQSDALLFIDTSYIQNEVRKALIEGGFLVNSVSATDNYNSSYTIVAVTQAEDYISNEQLRLYAQGLVSNHTVFTNYGIFNSAKYPLFSRVNVQVVNEQSIPKTVSYDDLQKIIEEKNSLANLLGLNSDIAKNFATGAGLSSPIVIGLGVLLLILYLKK